MPHPIDAAVEALRGDILDTLTRWLKIPSEKLPRDGDAPFGAPVRQMLTVALSDAKRLGFATRDFDGYIGDAEMGEGDETMGILAHLDVVPAGDGWSVPPYQGLIKDGRVYGRGSSDDKGPAVAGLFAMRAVLDAGLVPKKKVRLILGCDEESGWEDIRYYQARTEMPDFGFSPDADYPVINTEKGILRLTLNAKFGDEAGAAIPVYSIQAGARSNVVPGTATAEIGCGDIAALQKKLAETGLSVTCEAAGVGRARVTATGVTGHAALPEHTKNAAVELLMALSALGAGGGARPFIDAIAKGTGEGYSGKGFGIDGSDAISGALTMNLGVLRVADGKGSAVLDIRHPVLMDAQMIAKLLGMKVKDAGITVEINEAKAPLHVPADSKIVSSLLSVYEEITGKPGYTIAIGGGTYARSMDQCVAFGMTFPGDPDLAHQADENILVESLMMSVRIFAHAIARLCC